jgi:hypothetical protein
VFTASALRGTAHQPSLLDVLKFKRVCADYFLDVEMLKAGFDNVDLQKIRKALASHASYKTMVQVQGMGGVAGQTTSWIASLKSGSQACLRLLEDRDHTSQ